MSPCQCGSLFSRRASNAAQTYDQPLHVGVARGRLEVPASIRLRRTLPPGCRLAFVRQVAVRLARVRLVDLAHRVVGVVLFPRVSVGCHSTRLFVVRPLVVTPASPGARRGRRRCR